MGSGWNLVNTVRIARSAQVLEAIKNLIKGILEDSCGNLLKYYSMIPNSRQLKQYEQADKKLRGKIKSETTQVTLY